MSALLVALLFAGSSTGHQPHHSTVNTMGGAAPYAPVIPNDANTVLHFTGANYSTPASTLVPSIGTTLTSTGTVPVAARSWVYGSGIGPVDATNYLSYPTQPDILDFNGCWTACLVYYENRGDTGTPASDGVGNASGWYTLSNMGGPFQMIISTSFPSQTATTSPNLVGTLNVACFGVEGAGNAATTIVKLNGGASGTNNLGGVGQTPATSQAAFFGKNSTGGFPFSESILESWFSTTCASEAQLAAIEAPFKPSATVLALGDSITYGLNSTKGYPAYLNDLLGYPTYSVVNSGQSGNLVSQMKTRWETERGVGVNDLLLLGGVNDLIAGTTAATIYTTISTIYSEAVSDGVRVIPMTLTPYSGYASWHSTQQTNLVALNGDITSYANSNGLAYVDGYLALGQPGTPTAMATALTSDNLHPNAAGYQLLAQLAQAAVLGNKTQEGFQPLTAGAATVTFGTAYASPPTCTCVDQTSNHTPTCTPSTTQLVITNGNATDSIAWQCIGHT